MASSPPPLFSPPPQLPAWPPYQVCPVSEKVAGGCELDLKEFMLPALLGTAAVLLVCVVISRVLLTRKSMRSLAYHSGARASFIFSTGCLIAHAVMWHAQFTGVDCHGCSVPHEGCCPSNTYESPDGLLRAAIVVDVDYRAAGALDAAINAITNAECYQQGLYLNCDEPPPDPITMLRENICYALECGGELYEHTLVQMTYRHSISTAYYTTGWTKDPSLRPGTVWPARPAAYVLFAWSFLWPHVKLLVMHLLFYLPLPTGLRRNIHYWVAFFGKWSLCDPLVMSSLLGLVNLRVEYTFPDLWRAAEPFSAHFCNDTCVAHAHTPPPLSMRSTPTGADSGPWPLEGHAAPPAAPITAAVMANTSAATLLALLAHFPREQHQLPPPPQRDSVPALLGHLASLRQSPLDLGAGLSLQATPSRHAMSSSAPLPPIPAADCEPLCTALMSTIERTLFAPDVLPSSDLTFVRAWRRPPRARALRRTSRARPPHPTRATTHPMRPAPLTRHARPHHTPRTLPLWTRCAPRGVWAWPLQRPLVSYAPSSPTPPRLSTRARCARGGPLCALVAPRAENRAGRAQLHLLVLHGGATLALPFRLARPAGTRPRRHAQGGPPPLA